MLTLKKLKQILCENPTQNAFHPQLTRSWIFLPTALLSLCAADRVAPSSVPVIRSGAGNTCYKARKYPCTLHTTHLSSSWYTYRMLKYMQKFTSFSLKAKSAPRIYPHPAWEGLIFISFCFRVWLREIKQTHFMRWLWTWID